MCEHLFENGVDADTLVLPDNKFFSRVLFMLPNFFAYKPLISVEQFFKYGFAEPKIILVLDVIELVKRKHKFLHVKQSLLP